MLMHGLFITHPVTGSTATVYCKIQAEATIDDRQEPHTRQPCVSSYCMKTATDGNRRFISMPKITGERARVSIDCCGKCPGASFPFVDP